MSQALRKLTGTIAKSNTLVIFINQIRMKIGVMFGSPETTTGGNALKFYASVRLDIRRIGALKDGEKVVGNRTRVKVVKNKMAPPFREVEFDILYGEGISREGDIIDLGAECGAVEKSGAWFGFGGERIGQGRENAKQFLREHPEMAQKIETKMLAHFAIAATSARPAWRGGASGGAGATVHTLNAAAQAGQREESAAAASRQCERDESRRRVAAARSGRRTAADRAVDGAPSCRHRVRVSRLADSLAPVYDRRWRPRKQPGGPRRDPRDHLDPAAAQLRAVSRVDHPDRRRSRKSVRLVEEAIAKERPVIGILTQKDARTEDPGPGDLYMVGCAARILKVIKLAKDNFSVILQGVSRFQVLEFDGSEPFLTARVQALPDPTVDRRRARRAGDEPQGRRQAGRSS